MSEGSKTFHNGDNDSGKCSIHARFFFSIEGILKVVEFFTVLLAWAICADAYRHVKFTYSDRYTFFVVTGIICWVFVIIVISFNLFGCFNRCINGRLTRLFGWFIHLLAYSLIWVFLWLAGAIMLLFHTNRWRGFGAAGFFGLINLILFLVDSVMYYRVCRKYRVEIRRIRRGTLVPQTA